VSSSEHQQQEPAAAETFWQKMSRSLLGLAFRFCNCLTNLGWHFFKRMISSLNARFVYDLVDRDVHSSDTFRRYRIARLRCLGDGQFVAFFLSGFL